MKHSQKQQIAPLTFTREQLQQRDKTLFTEIYQRYSAALYGLLVAIVHDRETAEDLLQDSFIKIWHGLPSYDEKRGTLFTWMLNVTRNTAVDYLRSRRYQEQQKTEELPDYVYDHDNWSIQPNVDHIGLQELLDKLECELRRVVELAYFGGYTHSEIAEALGIPLGTVKTRLRAAILQLRALLRDEL